MAENVYNSAFTGAQIDEAISDVRNNKSKWNQAVTDAENALSDKANKPEIIETVLSASGWSNKTYSFESSYPNASYDIEIEPNNTCTPEQFKAWCDAQIVGSAITNSCKAMGDVPTINIPIILKVVSK